MPAKIEHSPEMSDDDNVRLDAIWDAVGAADRTDGQGVYGKCPKCGAHGQSRERRPNGNDTCVNGHVYPSATAVMESRVPAPGAPLEEAIDLWEDYP